MIDKECIAELEEKEKFLEQQIELRDKLIVLLLSLTEEPELCNDCVLKGVCTAAKYETCARGLLAAMQKADKL